MPSWRWTMHEDAVEILQQGLDKFEGEERIDLLFELADVYDDYEEFEKVFECLKWNFGTGT